MSLCIYGIVTTGQRNLGQVKQKYSLQIMHFSCVLYTMVHR